MQWERTTLFGCWVAAAAASLQSCPTLCDPIDGSPPGSPIPEILQARTLEWVAISFSNAWKWICSVMFDSVRPHGLQLTRLLHPWDFPGKSTAVGCHCLLRNAGLSMFKCPLPSSAIPTALTDDVVIKARDKVWAGGKMPKDALGKWHTLVVLERCRDEYTWPIALALQLA